jgi:hypothetical protein
MSRLFMIDRSEAPAIAALVNFTDESFLDETYAEENAGA